LNNCLSYTCLFFYCSFFVLSSLICYILYPFILFLIPRPNPPPPLFPYTTLFRSSRSGRCARRRLRSGGATGAGHHETGHQPLEPDLPRRGFRTRGARPSGPARNRGLRRGSRCLRRQTCTGLHRPVITTSTQTTGAVAP